MGTVLKLLKKPILSKLSSYATTPDGDDTMDECKKRSPHNLSNSGLGQQLAWGEHMGEQMMRNNAENNCSCFAGEDDEEQVVHTEHEHEADGEESTEDELYDARIGGGDGGHVAADGQAEHAPNAHLQAAHDRSVDGLQV